ncbi:hypothetical protein [Paraurantiacibacter namhicola]|uniref:NosL n=1 Tax=Paraurantiacibacter namhicola TaxID=645517 RepID=A0A1C7D7S8_9SPHN|nr:hypothetical protein [Paraurantiacibacter namhicola]ANU07539.1 hypothetical protein A6F65_01232 [Paraurantiacibacter namhicola]
MSKLNTLLTLAGFTASLGFAAPAAQAQVPDGMYKSKVGEYSIQPVASERLCGAIRRWNHPEYGEIQLMLLDYADEDYRVLSLTRGVVPQGLEVGRVNLELIFLDNGDTQLDRSWGQRLFGYQTREEKAFFVSQFDGEDDVAIGEDLAQSRALGLYNGDDLLLAVPLEGLPEAVVQLEGCVASL